MDSECLLNCECLLILKRKYLLNLGIVMKKKLSVVSASLNPNLGGLLGVRFDGGGGGG